MGEVKLFKKIDDSKVHIDFKNIEEVRHILDNYKDRVGMGHNEEDETQYIYVCEDYILVRTYQKNHWIRENSYWYNGGIEESYEGRWSDLDFR